MKVTSPTILCCLLGGSAPRLAFGHGLRPADDDEHKRILQPNQVDICHWNEGSKQWIFQTVSETAWTNAHTTDNKENGNEIDPHKDRQNCSCGPGVGLFGKKECTRLCSGHKCDTTPGDEVMITGPAGKVMLLPEEDPSTDYINIATISTSSGFEKGDFLVREEKGMRVYFDSFEEAFNYIANKGYKRMPKEEEDEWMELMVNGDGKSNPRPTMILSRPSKPSCNTPDLQIADFSGGATTATYTKPLIDNAGICAGGICFCDVATYMYQQTLPAKKLTPGQVLRFFFTGVPNRFPDGSNFESYTFVTGKLNSFSEDMDYQMIDESSEIIDESEGVIQCDNKKARIIPRHITIAVNNDDELNKLLDGVTIAADGVLPGIHAVLLPKKTK